MSSSRMKEPLVTLGLFVVMLLFQIEHTQLNILFPAIPDKSCTSIKVMGIKQWFSFLLYHPLSQEHLAYNMFSILWKSVLLEGCIGSRQFSLLILALLFIYDGLIISTILLWKLFAGAEICLPICHTGLSGLHFALSLPLRTNSEIFRSNIPVDFQTLCIVTLSAICALEIAVQYSLCLGFPFYGPVCGTLAGFLYSYKAQVFSYWNALFLDRQWLHPVLKISGATESQQLPETKQMIWSCSSCTYANSITASPYACSVCETKRSPDKAGLVWNCPTCTHENGVYFDRCEFCRTPCPVLA